MKSLSIVSVLILATLNADLAFAAQPTAEPTLRIETGLHLSKITGISSDAAGRLLLTASDDKTGRLWDPATGQLIRVYRVPTIEDSSEGALSACALSPDGRFVVLGGDTGQSWDATYSAYLFDQESGKLLRRLTGFSRAIRIARFSSDGSLLALNETVWETQNWSLRAKVDGFLFDEVDFAKLSGQWYEAGVGTSTGSNDAVVRLYRIASRLELVAEVRPKKPNGLSFGSSGSLLAVGLGAGVEVYPVSPKGFGKSFVPDLAGLSFSIDSAVPRFARKGDLLYSFAETAERPNLPTIRAWSKWGKGTFKDTTVPSSYFYGVIGEELLIEPLGEGSYAIAHADGSGWERIDENGEFKVAVGENRGVIGLAGPVGTSVTFDFTKVIGSSIFNTAERSYTTSQESTDSQRNDAQPDGLRDSGAYEGNVSDDGKLFVAVFPDNTVRWYRMKDGRKLLSLFAAADGKSWILWTPTGYYDASPGSEDFIGWQLNHGTDQAPDFFPASRFRSTYYRPDVISLILATLDEQAALAQANQQKGRKTETTNLTEKLPPVVRILSPDEGSEVSAAVVTLHLTIGNPSGAPLTGIQALIDGRPVPEARGVKVVPAAENDLTYSVTIPERSCQVSIIARNANGASEPASVNVIWKGASSQSFMIQPKLYILAVGVSKYDKPEYQLGFAAKDAKDFAASLVSQKGKIYQDIQTRVLTDADATKDNILDGLDWIQTQATQHDVAMVFFAGHGIDDSTGDYYYLPVGADIDKLRRTGLPFTEIRKTISSLTSKALFFIDTCHSGDVTGGRRGFSNATDAVVNELSSAENGAVVFTASTGRQYSLEDTAWGNGAFTKALVEGLSGEAAYENSDRITVNMLDLYVSERVKELTSGKQTPTTVRPPDVPDFPVAMK